MDHDTSIMVFRCCDYTVLIGKRNKTSLLEGCMDFSAICLSQIDS